MNLEKLAAALRAAADAITETQQAQQPAAPVQPAAPAPVQTQQTAAPVVSLFGGQQPAAAPPPAAAAAPPPAAAPAASQTDLITAFQNLSQAQGPDAVFAILGRHNLKRVAEAQPGQYPALIAEAQQAMTGGAA